MLGIRDCIPSYFLTQTMVPMKKVEKSFCCINIWFVSPHTKQVVCCPHQNHPPTNWGAALINRVGDKFHQINWMDIIVLSIQPRSIRSKINTWTKTDRFQYAQTFWQINASMKYFQLLSKHISTFWCRYQHSFYETLFRVSLGQKIPKLEKSIFWILKFHHRINFLVDFVFSA